MTEEEKETLEGDARENKKGEIGGRREKKQGKEIAVEGLRS